MEEEGGGLCFPQTKKRIPLCIFFKNARYELHLIILLPFYGKKKEKNYGVSSGLKKLRFFYVLGIACPILYVWSKLGL